MDFDVGDVVVCVDAKGAALSLRQGALYRVTKVEITEAGWSDEGTLGLYLAGQHSGRGHGGYRADRFRKLPKADDTFTAEVRALRPHREKLPA